MLLFLIHLQHSLIRGGSTLWSCLCEFFSESLRRRSEVSRPHIHSSPAAASLFLYIHPESDVTFESEDDLEYASLRPPYTSQSVREDHRISVASCMRAESQKEGDQGRCVRRKAAADLFFAAQHESGTWNGIWQSDH